ncbi:hypothetical protein ACFOY2_48550 [Nonomuraea purpurea]|uniref:Glycoside hydrolase family 5 domain-containing protein n=1 Tax=Nonomuraea purpurea TaxID=1849276 RepID=A0ABV8GMG9_9ACTN
MNQSSIPPGVVFGVVRGITYGLFGKPDEFVPQARELGAGAVRLYVYWGQVEPEPGRYVWDAVDALLAQLDGTEEVWITVCSSSLWATRQPTRFLPPSPAHDLHAYGAFVRALVARCAGRVRYWQCDNEPCSVGLLWAGTAEEYVAQLRVMHHAVKEVDPDALVVLGGAPYGLASSASDSPERTFFDVLLRDGREHFDVFDVHLYGDAARIPADVETSRQLMRAHGYEKPVVAGEYNGPWPDLYPEATQAMHEVMAAVFAAGTVDGADGAGVPGDGPARTPEQTAMAMLYDRAESLPPTLRMFMDGCPAELEAKRHRINCREIVMRNVLALSAGVRRTMCWNLAPEVPDYREPLSVMGLLFGKLALMDYEDGGLRLRLRHPAADAFALMAGMLAGVGQVNRVPVPGRASLFLFDVRRAGRGPLLVVWDQRDSFTGEDEPPVPFDWPWPVSDARALDVFGQEHQVEVLDGRLRTSVSVTPVFVTTREG